MCEREISNCEKLWKYLIAIQIVQIVFLVAFLVVFLVVFLLAFLVLFLIVFQIFFLIISLSSSFLVVLHSQSFFVNALSSGIF